MKTLTHEQLSLDLPKLTFQLHAEKIEGYVPLYLLYRTLFNIWCSDSVARDFPFPMEYEHAPLDDEDIEIMYHIGKGMGSYNDWRPADHTTRTLLIGRWKEHDKKGNLVATYTSEVEPHHAISRVNEGKTYILSREIQVNPSNTDVFDAVKRHMQIDGTRFFKNVYDDCVLQCEILPLPNMLEQK